ncbi:hypothetical protein N7456_010783 [Penicillium angulare]|uniref:DUF7703 domain-containing protein n=1 Tax=Penicillium angulare TaxID=116970 RepID=A0A9W9K029_9EURO|nr:hypothetical protein N7456_010783 [Penicillium angulare]
MDTMMSSLPPHMAEFLVKNIAVIEIVSMFSIGAYNALEVGLSIFNYFTHCRGLYYWSMQVASWGILLHGIPAQIRFLSEASNLSMEIPFIIGWYAMVTGQAVVLYSRLQLIVSEKLLLRYILLMIIINAMILHIPMTVLFFGVNQGITRLNRAANIYDRIQVTGFFLQDLVICAIYIHEARRALQPVLEVRGREGRKVIIHLIIVNVIVMILNIILLILEFKAHYLVVSFKTVVYSIKLKLEFAILTRLRLLTRTVPCACTDQPNTPRRSSDINVFDMALARSRTRPDIESPSLFLGASPSPRRLSFRGSTHEFHQALRETTSTENMISPVNICAIADSPAEKVGNRPRIGSADTRSTAEIVLNELPK